MNFKPKKSISLISSWIPQEIGDWAGYLFVFSLSRYSSSLLHSVIDANFGSVISLRVSTVTRWPFICEEQLDFLFAGSTWDIAYMQSHVIPDLFLLMCEMSRRQTAGCVNHWHHLSWVVWHYPETTFNCRSRRINLIQFWRLDCGPFVQRSLAVFRFTSFVEFPLLIRLFTPKSKCTCRMERMLMFGHWSNTLAISMMIRAQWFHSRSANTKAITWKM